MIQNPSTKNTNNNFLKKLSMEILACNLFLLIPLLLLPLHFLITFKTKRNGHLNNFPPRPPKLRIIAKYLQLRKPTHQVLHELSKIYGPVMFQQIGCVPIFVISSAEAAEQVLKTFDLEFCTRPSFSGSRRLSYNHLDIAMAHYGEYWREIRKICVLELLSTKRVQSFEAVRAEEIDVLIDSLSSSSSNSSPVDVLEKLASVTHRIISRVAFGSSTGDHKRNQLVNGKLTAVLNETLVVLVRGCGSDFFPRVGWIIDMFTGIHGRIEKCFHDLDEILQQMIDEHLDLDRLKPDYEGIIDVLLKLKKDQTSTIRLTNDHIKAVLADVFFAGVDTSAATMNWAMTELAKNPEVMKKVQEEIRSCVGSKGKVDESDLDRFHYLKMVVKETLRLHLPGPMLVPRECMKHSKIDGYDVFPKTVVWINAWGIGRNPKYWQNPEEFLPERFKDSSIDFLGSQTFEYLPFGGGRRGFPGMNMGLVMTELVLANVLYAFDLELPNGLKNQDLNMEEESWVGIHKKYPLKLVPIKHTVS